MGRMLNALKQIEDQEDKSIAPAAEKPLAETNDMPKRGPESEPDGGPEAELNFPDDLLADTTALLNELEQNEAGVEAPAIITAQKPRAKAWSRDSRHVDLATNILTQLPIEGPVSLLFAATASGGVFASSLVPLFSTLAERFEQRTLVVECDYRHAALARRFSVEPKFGLAEVLSSRATWPAAVCQSEQDGLDILCSRALASNVDQSQLDAKRSMLGEKGSPSWTLFEKILEEMHEQYRLVLLENVSTTDREMSQLAAVCHGAYLLLRMGQTPRRAARRSIKMVNNGGGQLLGCVLLDP